MTARGGAASGADVERSSLRLGAKQATGGQGHIHELLDEPGLLFKEFYNGRPDSHALSSLVGERLRLSPGDRAMLDSQAAWPLCRVTEGGQATGFLMNRVPDAFMWRTSGGNARLTEAQYLLRPTKVAFQSVPQPTPEERLELVRAYVALLDRLHDWGLVFGDISHANLLWSIAPVPAVHLIDCDGVRRMGGNPVLPQADTPDWDDPLVSQGRPTLDSDRYKIALLVVRILSRTPYARPGEEWFPVPGVLNDRQLSTVTRLLTQAAGAAGSRPDMRQWAAALSDRRTIPLMRPVPRQPLTVDDVMLDDSPSARRIIRLRP